MLLEPQKITTALRGEQSLDFLAGGLPVAPFAKGGRLFGSLGSKAGEPCLRRYWDDGYGLEGGTTGRSPCRREPATNDNVR